MANLAIFRGKQMLGDSVLQTQARVLFVFLCDLKIKNAVDLIEKV